MVEILGQDKNLNLIDIAARENKSVLLIGETGSGKTSMVQYKAEQNGMESVRFNLTGETTVDEFVGRYELEKKQTVWKDGILIQAMKEGKWLVLDEINAALPDILFILHPLLDDDKHITVTHHNAEVVTPHPDFRLFATMNPSDEYAGTKTLNKAFQSRFQIVLDVAYPDNDTEKEILTSRTEVTEDQAYMMLSVANKVREAKKNKDVFFTLSTRDLLHWASLIPTLSIEESFKVSIYNKSNEDKEKLKEIYNDTIGAFVDLKRAGNIYSPTALKEAVHKLETQREEIKKEMMEKLEKLINA